MSIKNVIAQGLQARILWLPYIIAANIMKNADIYNKIKKIVFVGKNGSENV